MRAMRFSIAAWIILTSAVWGQSAPVLPMPSGSLNPTTPPPAMRPAEPVSPSAPLYRDLDMLRRDGFSTAEKASISLKIVNKDGTPADLQRTEYELLVNGTPRKGRLHAPGDSDAKILLPLVLLVFPPNQPIVHSIGVREAIKYFTQQPEELLPWRVGIFDSNAKLTAFTDGRSQLLLNLNLVANTVEPFEYAGDQILPSNQRWDGSWMTKAGEAIAMMQRFDGPKVILAMNPVRGSMYGMNDQILAYGGPDALKEIARHVGAHIYIANVGGPDAFAPSGDAAEDRPAQINLPGTNGPRLGSVPSGNMRVDPAFNNALNGAAASNSAMMLAAQDTQGGFANSLNDLAAKIHRDLDGAWSLDFDMTPHDRDLGIPSVVIKPASQSFRVAIMDVIPVGIASEGDQETLSKALVDKVRKATERRITSPDFRITQHVDYFPVRSGLKPVLPMTSLIEWTGPGRGPDKLFTVESVDDLTLSTPVMERAVQARWDGHRLSWERDGHLNPGQYLWRISVHDGNGRVFASAEEKIAVDIPRQTAIEYSSLIIGKSCREQPASVDGLRRRHTDTSDDTQLHPTVDPMRAIDCRIKPEASDRFASTDRLHAFVRIYPSEKLDKHGPDSWTAKFILRSNVSPITAEKETSFRVDSGSGYLAYVEMSLDTPGMDPGMYTLDVVMHGPGIRRELKVSRAISIQAATTP
ncbi:hypothetical protein [Granulicella sp. S190]|uniref:hypothetical protein n=1 Tax=Granulicella sp. S190 TaxID=1747226 RepID=UPI00131E9D2B|nr:hypothetical protein [Granulicella sp. S190]